jgi:uncharacterized protein YuzE
MHYDPESNIANIEISGGKISHAVELGNFIIHLSSAGAPVLIEILDASRLVGEMGEGGKKSRREIFPAASGI